MLLLLPLELIKSDCCWVKQTRPELVEYVPGQHSGLDWLYLNIRSMIENVDKSNEIYIPIGEDISLEVWGQATIIILLHSFWHLTLKL